MSKRRYEVLRDKIELMHDIEELIKAKCDATQRNEVHRRYVKQVRDYIKEIDREFVDPLAKPITDGWRTVIDDPDDIALEGYDYRILDVKNADEWDDQFIEDYIMSEVGYPPICSPYDCTGKRFTSYVSFSRQPAGIVMIHRWGTDL